MKERSRVLLVNLGPKQTGVGNYARLIIKYGNLKYDILNINLYHLGSPENYPTVSDAKTFFYGQKSDNILKNFIFNYFLLKKKDFLGFLDNIENRYDVILLDQQDFAMMADMFKLKFNCDIHITVHDIGYFKHSFIHPLKFILNKNLRALKSNSIKSVMCDSYHTAEKLAERYPDISGKIRIVELSVDQTKFTIRNKEETRKKLNLPNGKILVLNVGKDGYIKNVSNFINSIRYVNNDDIIYIRVGKLTYSRKIYDKLPQQLKERIIIVEGVSDDILPFYYSASDIFVFPSLREGFGLELVEAHLSGNVIVTTDRPPMNDLIIPKASLLIKNPERPDEIANLIDEASSKFNLMTEKLMNEIKIYKNRFSNERFINNVESILQRYS